MNNKRLIAVFAAALIFVAIAGVLVGKYLFPPTVSAPVAEQEEDHAEEEGMVELTDEQIKTSKIEVITLTPSSLEAQIIAQGSVAPTPQGQAILSAGAEGRVTRIQKRLGDPVRRGEILATIESREAAGISSEVKAAAARAALAQSQLAREQRLFDEKITARADLESARAENQQAAAEASRARQAAAAAGVSGRFIAVRAPIGGRITSAPAILGSYVTAQDELFRIANPDRIQIEAQVPAEDARRINVGDTATVENSADEITTRVLAVTPAADPENRAAIVVLESSADARLVPGEYVRVKIMLNDSSTDTSKMIVPAEAVQTVEGREVVFVRTKEGFRARPVRTGARGGDRVEILEGLSAGTNIAGRNAFLLKSELGRGEAEH
ncbi:efflux RND transporter periplasmic adaptor subunit [Parasphingorhabdus sp.]|uniref:efflux RND transporter periplasmic adaptor subunit n=1 Tax=Parasphingorhabdus sp. TaxID=2709688 RepID=UPI003D26838E